MNVVSDAIMCVQARRDPEYGSQELISFTWIATGFGGIFGALFGGYMTEHYDPRYCFLFCSFGGLVVSISGAFLNPLSEVNPGVPETD